MIRVLLVDDSATTAAFISALLDADDELSVVGRAQDGEQAIRLMTLLQPDIVVMDINMPKMNGYEATRRILGIHPVPIIICSNIWQPGEMARSFEAIEAGAVTAIPKPPGPGHPDFKRLASLFVQTVKAMAEIRVVCRKPWQQMKKIYQQTPISLMEMQVAPQLLAMGASTGGPPAIKAILEGLNKKIPLPIVIVQHIATGFVEGMASWLGKTISLPVKIAEHEERLQAGHVYLAPAAVQMGVAKGRIVIDKTAYPENGLRPAISFLFRSVAEEYGMYGIGVLLTGMGKDGAAELLALRKKGALTIAQDEASAVVNGMPGEAVKLEAASYVLPPVEISRLLNKVTQRATP
ncbi:MAG: chemotaxis-specific protein-glutamate methyltransferase CheB [Proteobacteria bacterium]|nr:chemotaxis-specific protein-glutamate methyltransferase CheB [Pseudomonadota bacterium]MBU0965939.1 chemotaxis-specific protein-glutamate methyltransferase CheB [Pseudomonadota bacterium]